MPTPLFGADDDERAKDLSGIACAVHTSASSACLLINDENRTAQFVTLEDRKLVAEAEIKLVGDRADPHTLGTKPTADCPNGRGGFKEFDGEGVAYAPPFYYVVGSHGCSRNSSKFRLSSFILARIQVDSEGAPVLSRGRPVVDTTYRLSDYLRASPRLSAFFGKGLNEAGGLNVEGIAVMNGHVLIGLRAPSIDRRAFIVRIKEDDLFAPGAAPGSGNPEVISLELGANVGIRDIAPLGDGRLLVLSGPAQEQSEISYRLHVADLRGTATPVQELSPVVAAGVVGKAEAITVLETRGAEARVLVLFDGLLDGAPRAYRIPLQ